MVEALETAQALNGKFGQDCFLLPDHSLSLPLTFIQQCLQTSAQPDPEPCKRCPTRLDREIELDPKQQAQLLEIQAIYQQDWVAAAGNPYRRRLARRKLHQLKLKLRAEVLTPLVDLEITPGVTLVYGGFFLDALCQHAPDGRSYTVETLIHFTHPVSAEDLFLREHRVQCDRILRYRIPGLDDAEWMRQNEPRQTLDAQAWRALLLKRTYLLSTGLW